MRSLVLLCIMYMLHILISDYIILFSPQNFTIEITSKASKKISMDQMDVGMSSIQAYKAPKLTRRQHTIAFKHR